MNSKAKKLKPIAGLAQQNEKGAARSHGKVLQELKQQEDQLEELNKYREQYLQSFTDAGKVGLSAIQLQDYRIFLQRLDDAIIQQKQVVAEKKANTQVSKSTWIDKRNKSKMINKVVENRQKVEDKDMEKREQKEMDDRPFVKSKL